MEELNLSIADYARGTKFPVRNDCNNPICPVDHGMSLLELRWFYKEPLTVFAFAEEDSQTGVAQDFVVSRDLFLEALRSGTGTGFPVVGEGNVMCQVLADNRALMGIAFNEGYIILAERNSITEWLMGTYVYVPQALEEQVLDLDRVISQLLYK